MTDLRVAVADAINRADYPGGTPLAALFPDIAAGAVLAMPELQAIIALLRHERDQWCCLDCWLMHLSRYNTPLTVIAWIDQTGADHG